MIKDQALYQLPFETIGQLQNNNNVAVFLHPKKNLMRIVIKNGGAAEVALVSPDIGNDEDPQDLPVDARKVDISKAYFTQLWGRDRRQLDIERQSVDEFIDSVEASLPR